MLKRFLSALKKPLWISSKLIFMLSVTITAIALFPIGISAILGAVGGTVAAPLSAILLGGTNVFLTSLQILFSLIMPFVFVYSGAKAFVTYLIPQKEKTPSKDEEVAVDKEPFVLKKKETIQSSEVTQKRVGIQQQIIDFLEEHEDKLDLEDAHLLERINKELLSKTEDSYNSLSTTDQSKYQEEVLEQFASLEGMVTEIIEKSRKESEKNLKKQIQIIEQIKR